MILFRSRNGIVTGATPGVAAEDAFQRKPEAFERPVLAEGLEGVLRAGRGEAAGWPLERRDAELIEFDQQDKRRGEDPLDGLDERHTAGDSPVEPANDGEVEPANDGEVEPANDG